MYLSWDFDYILNYFKLLVFFFKKYYGEIRDRNKVEKKRGKYEFENLIKICDKFLGKLMCLS